MTVYRVDLRALPSDIPEAIRLRRFLKAALRSYGFRCVAVEQNGTAKAIEDGAPISGPSSVSTREIEREPGCPAESERT